MAILKSGIEFVGSLGDVSAYKMRGVDGIVLRTKGGASKEQIKKSGVFVNTRRLNAEFKGCSKGSKWIRSMLRPLKALADHNFAGTLTGLLKPVQKLDTTSIFGERNVLLSKKPGILEGFSFNKQTIFEAIVTTPVTYNISRETLSAEVLIPELISGANFKPHPRYRQYGFQAVLGIVPDLFYQFEDYKPVGDVIHQVRPVLVESAWFSTGEGSPPQKLELKQNVQMENEHFSLMLAIGIRYGAISKGDTVEQVKYAGAAKIVRVV